MCIWEQIVQYHTDIRTSLFVSGVTIGSFLFTMKSTIIKTLKDDIFDTEEYKKDLVQKIVHSKKAKAPKYYGSLSKFSSVLFWAITLSFISSLSQITVGFIDNSIVRTGCLLIALASWALLAYAVFLVRANWSIAITFQEKEKELSLQQAIEKFENESKIK